MLPSYCFAMDFESMCIAAFRQAVFLAFKKLEKRAKLIIWIFVLLEVSSPLIYSFSFHLFNIWEERRLFFTSLWQWEVIEFYYLCTLQTYLSNIYLVLSWNVELVICKENYSLLRHWKQMTSKNVDIYPI